MTKKEINLPVIPKFVADFIEQNKYGRNGQRKSIRKELLPFFDYVTATVERVPNDVYYWVNKKGNLNKIIRAIINGYEIEKETQYELPIELISNNGHQYIVERGHKAFALGCNSPIFKKCKSRFTKEELKELPNWCRELAMEVREDE